MPSEASGKESALLIAAGQVRIKETDKPTSNKRDFQKAARKVKNATLLTRVRSQTIDAEVRAKLEQRRALTDAPDSPPYCAATTNDVLLETLVATLCTAGMHLAGQHCHVCVTVAAQAIAAQDAIQAIAVKSNRSCRGMGATRHSRSSSCQGRGQECFKQARFPKSG